MSSPHRFPRDRPRRRWVDRAVEERHTATSVDVGVILAIAILLATLLGGAFADLQ